MKPLLQRCLPVPCNDFALSTRGTQVTYTEVVRTKGMPCKPGGKHKSLCCYRKAAGSPSAPVQLFPECKKTNKINRAAH